MVDHLDRARRHRQLAVNVAEDYEANRIAWMAEGRNAGREQLAHVQLAAVDALIDMAESLHRIADLRERAMVVLESSAHWLGGLEPQAKPPERP